jgi:hypothetical protein
MRDNKARKHIYGGVCDKVDKKSRHLNKIVSGIKI